MSTGKTHISVWLRTRVAQEARYRCGYCLRTEELVGMPMTIDHIIAEAAGGTTTEDNLWLACNRCNQFKGTQTKAQDSVTKNIVSFFHPRIQTWSDHFEWSQDGTEIIGKTPSGRVTVTALRMNNPEIVVTRRLWVSAGWWPPQD